MRVIRRGKDTVTGEGWEGGGGANFARARLFRASNANFSTEFVKRLRLRGRRGRAATPAEYVLVFSRTMDDISPPTGPEANGSGATQEASQDKRTILCLRRPHGAMVPDVQKRATN